MPKEPKTPKTPKTEGATTGYILTGKPFTGPRVNPNDTFTFLKKAEVKIAPQAQVILNTIEAAGTIKRDELDKQLTGVLQTRQPVGRIVAYYTKLLTTETGCVSLSRSTEPAAKAA